MTVMSTLSNLPSSPSCINVTQGTSMLHLHDHGQLLGTTRDAGVDADTSDLDDGPPFTGRTARRRRDVGAQPTQSSQPQQTPRQPLNALASLAAWQGVSVVDMAQQLCTMSENERMQLRTDYAMAEESQ